MKSRFFRITVMQIILSALVLCSASCRSSNCIQPTAAKPAVTIGLYVDSGSAGSGVFQWARLVAFSPQAKLVTLTGEDVRNGKLDEIDMFLMPGGHPGRQCTAMTPAGAEKLKNFLKKGGSYVGSCAGLTCTLNDPPRLRLLPFKRLQGTGGANGYLQIDLLENGAKLMDVKPGKRIVTYASGPIPKVGSKPDPTSTGEVLALYKNTISYIGKAEGGFFNQPAQVYGTLGKGKIIATSYHPESLESTHDLALGCIYAVTGVKLTPMPPAKTPRPYRVGFFASAPLGHKPVKTMLALEMQPDMDVHYMKLRSFDEGVLNHLDVFVIPAGIVGDYQRYFTDPDRIGLLKKFMDKGGRIFIDKSCADTAKMLKHSNLQSFDCCKSLVRAIK